MSTILAYNLYPFDKNLYLPSVYIVSLDNDGKLAHIQKKNVKEPILKEASLESTTTIKKLFSLINLLSPQALETKFNRQNKNPIPITSLLIDEKISLTITSYISRHLGEFLTLIVQEQLPICFDMDAKVIASWTQLATPSVTLTPEIYFEKQNDSLLYRLALTENGRVLKLKDNPCILVNNDPAWIILDGRLLHLEGINSARLKPFFTKDEVIVPKKNLKEYYQKIILPLVEKIDFEHQGFEVVHYSNILKAELTMTHNFITQSYGIGLNFDYGKTDFNWKESNAQKSFLDFKNETDIVIYHVKRNSKQESIFVDCLQNMGLFNTESNCFEPKDTPQYNAQKIINWLTEHQHSLIKSGFTVCTPQIDDKKIALIPSSLSNLKLTEQNDWFDLTGDVIIGDFTFPFAQLIPFIRNNNPYFELPNGNFALIPEEWFAEYQGMAQMGKTFQNGVRISRSQAPSLLPKAFFQANGMPKEDFQWVQSPYLKAKLRPYQIEGVQWLLKHYHDNSGACLADDMGLGKTLQTIAALLYAKENKKNTAAIASNAQMDMFGGTPEQAFFVPLQALIVLPASLVFNWEMEWRKFAPAISIEKHVGSKRQKDLRILKRHDVILTTYQTLAKDVDILEKIAWEYIVLDESQYIKNKNSDTFKAVHRLNGLHKVSLSGTPIENSLADLWAQMAFINPDLLNSYAHFDKNFMKPIENNVHAQIQKDRLKDLVKPYLLRRTKQEVAKDLPDIMRQIVYSEMDSEQKNLYEKEKNTARNLLLSCEISNKSAFENRNIILKTLTKLRQIAIHPKLVFQDYKGESAKYNDVLSKWQEARLSNHKMLIFSTFVENLRLYRTHFEGLKHLFSWLTGENTSQEKQQNVLNFNENEAIQTFLISLKAGGTGLNLTAADYVFILDPWWNPAAEEQAIARAHRIGQTKNVMALQFIVRDTIEEKILLLQDRKRQLVTDILDFESIPSFSKDDLTFLLE